MRNTYTSKPFKKAAIAAHTHDLKTFLTNRCHTVELKDEEGQEGLVFFIEGDAIQDLMTKYGNIYRGLNAAGMIQFAPVAQNAGFIYFTEDPYTEAATVTSGYVRLPRMEYLLNLSIEDFYAFFQILANAKNTSGGTMLALDLAAGDLDSLFTSNLGQFFNKKVTNYRMNPELVSRKWTPRSAIKFVAELPKGRESQLSALQYLSCFSEKGISYFPLETAIELELEFRQLGRSDYCAPPRED